MLYLASNSPRRKQLLALGGWSFTVLAAPVDESVLPGETPEAYVRRLAESKAWAALPRLAQLQGGADEPAWIVAADTTVADCAGAAQILGKPADAAEAQRMLRQLRGRVHQVLTGAAVLRIADRALRSAVEVTQVYMRDYSDAEIDAYIAGGDPMDKAGAYAIQHPGFHPVQNLQGCHANVIGLPVCRLAALLSELGAPPHNGLVEACQKSLQAPCPIGQQAMGAAGQEAGR
ncbi:MAG: Maf family protein [Chloroflexota bacterium]